MSAPAKHVILDWAGGLRFRGGAPDRPGVLTDGDGQEAPDPMSMLLIAAAACSGADVVSILAKMQVRLERFRIEVVGTRREDHPRRYVDIALVFELAGEGLDEAKARRAIDLSLQKYCSVIHSLAPDITIGHELKLG
ncbi:MAG: OsmC family protein [Gemmatimonadota bacterium]